MTVNNKDIFWHDNFHVNYFTFTYRSRIIIFTSFIMSLWMVLWMPAQSEAQTFSDEANGFKPLLFSEFGSGSQSLTVHSDSPKNVLLRDSFTIVEPVKPKPAKKASVSPAELNEAQSYAASRVGGGEQWDCLYSLWSRESGWRWNAENVSSGAYGIPQALPGSKMASVGADWQTNPVTQIEWGLGYINGRYGSACNAWQHSENVGWY